MSDPLADLDFDIECEYGCGRPAEFMGKGCADLEHVAACRQCMTAVYQNFYAIPPSTLCLACFMPIMLGFRAHFDVRAI